MARFAPPQTPGEGPGFLAIARAALVLLVVMGVVGAIVYSAYLRYTDLRPPEIAIDPVEIEVDPTGRKLSAGMSWIAREHGMWHLHLEGSPSSIGWAHGALAGQLFHRLDSRIEDLLRRRYPGDFEAWSATSMVRWNYRDADAALAPSEREELAAYAAGLPEAAGAEFSGYQRLLLYQCFQELSDTLDDVVIEGNMFASTSKPGRKGDAPGNLVVGRSLSVDLGEGFGPLDGDRVISFYYPDGKYPFVSVGWPGMTGVTTGINARGILVALNTTRTDDAGDEGLPVSLVLRRVLEEADTLDSAIEILEGPDVRTSAAVLIADGMARRSAIVEMAPRAKEENRQVRGEKDSSVWSTNHLVRDAFERDAENDRLRRSTSSGYRYERLGELIAAEPVTPDRAVEILRDRLGKEGLALGLGNPNAIDNLARSHAIVVDTTSMVMWVSQGPSALGKFRAFDLRYWLMRKGDRPAPREDIAPDRLLHSEAYHDYEEALDAITYAKDLLARGLPKRAQTAASVALTLAPEIGSLHRLLGDIERELDNPEAALKHYKRYLELVPARLRDQERVRGIMEELGGSG
ncbi:MAG: C45 family autoproteolytic acyltransferase/hydrolase [Nannocystaceae bacterium]